MSPTQLDDWYRDQGIRAGDQIIVVPLRGRLSGFNILDPSVRAEWAKQLRAIDAQYLVLDCLRPFLDALGLDEQRDIGRFLVAFDMLLAEARIPEAAVVHRRLSVERAGWRGQVTAPKGGQSRQVPLTKRLTAALVAQRHLRSDRVLCLADGSPITRDRVIKAIRSAERAVGLRDGGVHILRHTFCSHLAMRGAAARAIQEVAGHADLSTTQRYMHLSPAATEEAIRLLDGPRTAGVFGDIVETEEAVAGTV